MWTHLRLRDRSAILICLALGLATCIPVFSQQRPVANDSPGSTASDLPNQPIGVDDLLSINVYNAPELSRPVRVNSDGTIRLPMLQEKIKAVGARPNELEEKIAKAFSNEQILVNPIVSVGVIEYRSRPISVVGAVRRPTTFQAANHGIRLLDAIAQAEGFSENAGPDILVSRFENSTDGKPVAVVRRISRKQLLDGVNSELNLTLEGGEEIRVPEAGKIYIVGNVKRPGVFPIQDSAESSVMKALAFSEGLLTYTSSVAYIYRRDDATGKKDEIPIELKKIIGRKAPDVPLLPNDILYVPDRPGRRLTMTALEKMVLFGSGITAAAVYAGTR